MKGNVVRTVREFLKETPVANIGSISRLVGNRGYAHLLMNYLVRREEVRRITRGYYTVHEDPTLLVYCMKPAYIGLQDAVSLHNLWEQETIPIVVTSRRVRSGIRKVMGQNVLVRRISGKYLFGHEYLERGGFLLPVSNIEKTFIDLVYFGEMRRDFARRFKGKVDHRNCLLYTSPSPRD